MSYTTETAVYDRTGMSSANIQGLSGKDSSEVTTLVNGYISDAQDRIREDIDYPLVVYEEKHLGDGEKNTFKLGPQDERFMTLGDYDPTNNLIKIYNMSFGTRRGK